jgi:DNA-binding transcriptional regulator YhcF (GntR family)
VSTARRTADDRQPRYLRIHSTLRDRITSGRWPAGSPLPSQRELAGEFSVSIMTLRQALQLLADDGLIDTRHGSGTYVASRYAYGLGHLRSFAADLAAQGAQITTRLLAADTVAAPDDVGARLARPARSSGCAACGWPTAGRSSSRRPISRRSWPRPWIPPTSAAEGCTPSWPSMAARSAGPARPSPPWP